jgi:hypothetical protein
VLGQAVTERMGYLLAPHDRPHRCVRVLTHWSAMSSVLVDRLLNHEYQAVRWFY